MTPEQNEFFSTMQLKLEAELKNYEKNKQQFTTYTKTMNEIDEWLAKKGEDANR